MSELEENKKKLKISETKAFLYRERALKEKKKIEKFKEEKDENILNTSFEFWSSDPFAFDLNNTFNSIISSSKSPTPN